MFIAAWCGFCRIFKPIFEAVLRDKGLPGASVDLSDYDNPLWERFDIHVVPTVIVFKEGQLAHRSDGVLGRGLSKEVMEQIVQKMKSDTLS